MYGKKHTDESRRKISIAKTGKTHVGVIPGAETRRRQSLAKLGKKLSKEHAKNISIAAKKNGHGKWMTGKKHSKETIMKISQVVKRGEECNFWKGGITPLHNQIRHSLEYKNWRRAIFERDNYTCQGCGVFGGDLCVDHYPKPFSQIIFQYKIKSMEDALLCEELWDISENRTLCKPCHKMTPTYLKGWDTRKAVLNG